VGVSEDGEQVGTTDGLNEGSSVVGVWLGILVGCSVVGILDGMTVGERVGWQVGVGEFLQQMITRVKISVES
jgi:hypothetical protein